MKNYTLYFLEFLASILVINIHSTAMLPIGRIPVLVFSRCAVPFFFMVNGYFLYRSQQDQFDQVIRRRIRKNLIFTGKGLVVYFLINVFAAAATHSLPALAGSLTDPHNLFYFLVLNWTTPYFGVGHLWYLFALLYVLVFLRYTMRYIERHLLPTSLILLSITFFLEYVNFTGAYSVPEIWYRNSVLLAFPCIAIGYLCAQNHEKLMQTVTGFNLLIWFILSGVVFYLEYQHFGYAVYLYIHSVLFALGALLFALKVPTLLSGRNIFVQLGAQDSHDIYMWHYVPIILLSDFGISLKYRFSFVLLVVAAGLACKHCLQRFRHPRVQAHS